MLNVLPESRPRRQRRTGGATTSVALHVAIIGVVTATTAQLPRDTGREPVTMVPLPPIVERRVTSQPDAGAPVASRGIATTVLRRITLTEIPTTIPPIDLSAPATPDPGTGVVDFGPPGSTTLGGRGIPAARDTGSGTWNASETLMRVISVIRPRYPEPLRNAVIGWIGLHGCGELIGRDACELHEPVIHGAGVDVFAFSAGQHGAAFIDHSRQMDITF